MKKILLYFTLFLNFYNVNAATDSIQKEEFEQCERLCNSLLEGKQRKGYLQKSVLYLRSAFTELSKENPNEKIVNDAVDKAAWSFVQARLKDASLEEIDQYFSRQMPFTDGESSMIEFGAYLKDNNIGCFVEDIRNAMIECYFKKDRWCLIM